MDVTPYIVAIISVTLSLAAITVSTSINPAKRDDKENDNKYKFSKPSVPPPLPFSGETKDWPQWKRQTRCTMGMVGLLKVIDDGDYAYKHTEENQTAYHMLENAVAAGNASSIFSNKGIENNGYMAWAQLVLEYDGAGQREPEAMRVRAQLDAIRLNTRTTGHLYKNAFRECVNKLAELNEAYSENAYIEKFIRQIEHPDYDGLKEILKSQKYKSLDMCYQMINNKAAELSTEKIIKLDTSITPRNTSVRFNLPEPYEEGNEDVDIKKYTQSNGIIRFPNTIWRTLSPNKKEQILSHNRKIRSKRPRRDDDGPDDTQIHTRRLASTANKRRKAEVKARALKLFEDFISSTNIDDQEEETTNGPGTGDLQFRARNRANQE